MKFAMAALFLASLAMRMPFHVYALGGAGHDDQLFVKLAEQLRAGRWLGPYDSLTLAKGAAYSMFMAVTSRLHLPLKLAEHLVYLIACLGFAHVAGSILRSRWAALACFAILALNPVFWVADIAGRVVRENLYVSLSVGLLALALRAYALPAPGIRTLAALGGVGAVYWLTREEGIWLVPALALIVGAWFLHQRSAGPGASGVPASMRVALGVPLLAFAALVGLVNAGNYLHYGVFINNEFRARSFPAAYGALARIEHDRWRPYVVFPRDARERAYAMSPAARSLAPLFEGPRGEFWRKVGCEQTKTEPCPEILSGWFMWALREAVEHAGHGSAVEVRAFERQLAREINRACDDGRIACRARSDSLVPPWRPEYLPRILEATADVAGTLLTLGRLGPSLYPSTGEEQQLAQFRKLTRGPLARSGDLPWVGFTAQAALTRVQAGLLTFGFPLATLGWMVLLGFSIARREWHAGHVLVAALLLAVGARVGLLGLLEATSIPSNNLLYLMPVTPMAMALAPVVAFLAFDVFARRDRHGR